MVEIIKCGQLPSERTYITTCNDCKTMFRFMAKESEYNPGYDQRETAYRTINCPLCSSNCSVQDSAYEKAPDSGYKVYGFSDK